MKQILMVLFKDIDYDARVQREAIALAEDGFRVSICCINEFDTPGPFLHEEIKVHKFTISTKQAKKSVSSNRTQKTSILTKVVRSPVLKLAKDQYAAHEFYNKIKRQLSSLSFDAIHSHDLNTLLIGKKLSDYFECKLVYDSHELFNEMTGRNQLDRRFGYFMEGNLLKHVDRLISVNPFLLEKFENRYGPHPSIYLQNIPLVREEANHKNNHYFHHLYGFSTDKTVLLYQGGFSRHRGIELCVKAMKHLSDQYRLVLLGDGDIKGELEDLVKTEGLDSQVFFHHKVSPDEILSLTKEADIGLVMYENVSENNYFSTPNKIFEYMLMGLPVVSSNHPGKAYILDEYDFGLAVEETVDDIVRAVKTIDQRYDYYVQKCQDASKELNWPTESKKLTRLYQELLS